jgi:hypothetical protein
MELRDTTEHDKTSGQEVPEDQQDRERDPALRGHDRAEGGGDQREAGQEAGDREAARSADPEERRPGLKERETGQGTGDVDAAARSADPEERRPGLKEIVTNVGALIMLANQVAGEGANMQGAELNPVPERVQEPGTDPESRKLTIHAEGQQFTVGFAGEPALDARQAEAEKHTPTSDPPTLHAQRPQEYLAPSPSTPEGVETVEPDKPKGKGEVSQEAEEQMEAGKPVDYEDISRR